MISLPGRGVKSMTTKTIAAGTTQRGARRARAVAAARSASAIGRAKKRTMIAGARWSRRSRTALLVWSPRWARATMKRRVDADQGGSDRAEDAEDAAEVGEGGAAAADDVDEGEHGDGGEDAGEDLAPGGCLHRARVCGRGAELVGGAVRVGRLEQRAREQGCEEGDDRGCAGATAEGRGIGERHSVAPFVDWSPG
jgi:hypothetical protein